MTQAQTKGPKYEVNIEGRLFPWNDETITVPQIRTLGGLSTGTPVLEVDLQTGTSRELPEDAIVQLRPGIGFGKKIEFRRGGLTERMSEELLLLRTRYPEAEFREDGQWVRVPRLSAPPGIWSAAEYDICFQLRPGYPDVSPYGMNVSPRARGASGEVPGSYSDDASPPPPFPGEWGKFSVEPTSWMASADVALGSNILDYIEAFRGRLAQVL